MLFAEVSSLVQPAFLAGQIRWLHRIYMVWRPFSERGAKACWEMNGTAVAWDVGTLVTLSLGSRCIYEYAKMLWVSSEAEFGAKSRTAHNQDVDFQLGKVMIA